MDPLTAAAAKKGLKVSWEFVKVMTFIALVVAVCSLAFCAQKRANEINTELTGLREFRQSVEARNAWVAAADKAAALARTERTEHDRVADDFVVTHQQETQEAARADPQTASFLDAPIPRRLLEADAAARRSGRLEEGRKRR